MIFSRKRILILGGGISGRLAQVVFPEATILEAGKKGKNLTRMWGTNYLWKPLPIDWMEFRKFKVITTVDKNVPTPESIAAYKRKIGKPEDIGDWGLQFEHISNGYDIATWPVEPQILWDHTVKHINLRERFVICEHDEFTVKIQFQNLISTIPLDILVRMSGLEPVGFHHSCNPITVEVMKVAGGPTTPVMLVDYNSDLGVHYYRETLRDGTIHRESLVPVPQSRNSITLYPGKIRTNHQIELMRQVVEQQGVILAGRYAAWRPNELVHETFDKLSEWRGRL